MSTACEQAPPTRRGWRMASGLWTAFKAFQIRRQHRNATRILDRLDDKLLKDMGISRGESQSVVYGRSAETTDARDDSRLG